MTQQTNYDRLLGILGSVLDAYSVVLFLPEPEDSKGETYFIASSFSLGNHLNHHAEICPGRGLVGWILRNREPLLVANFDQHQNHLGYYAEGEEKTIKAFMGCPLPGGGALCVDSKRQYSFSEKDQKLLHLFADLVAQLEAENSGREEKSTIFRYYAALRTIYTLRHQHSRWAEFLRHFLDLMASMTGFTHCLLCTRDPGGQSYSIEGENTLLLQKPGVAGPSFPLSHGIVGWVFRNGSLVCSDGPGGSPEALLVGKAADIPQFQTVLAVPIVIQRKTRGVLCLAHDVPMAVNEATQDFVRMASEHLALFLENLYIKCRLRDLHQHMTAMTGPQNDDGA